MRGFEFDLPGAGHGAQRVRRVQVGTVTHTRGPHQLGSGQGLLGGQKAGERGVAGAKSIEGGRVARVEGAGLTCHGKYRLPQRVLLRRQQRFRNAGRQQ